MKKLLLFFGLICMINLMFAQEPAIRWNGNGSQRSGDGQVRWGEFNPTVPQDSILFWTGTGSNRAVVAVTWNDAVAGNIGVAWGVQWNGTGVSILMIMDTIAAYDSRFTVTSNATVANLIYVDNELGLNLVGPDYYWWYNWKAADGSAYSSQSAAADMLTSGDFVDWLPMDPDDWSSYPADLMIMATDPNGGGTTTDPVEATIAASDILFWVGEGSNEAVMAVNWADTALAWGYRWNGTATVSEMMDHIAAADPRFSYELGAWGLDDILFVVAEGDTLRKAAYSYWESKNNGVMDAGMGQPLVNGDFEKWAEPAAGVIVDSTYDEYYNYWWYTYAYPMTIHPVTVPDTTGGGVTPPNPGEGPFCGGVGTAGCNAIAADDNAFVAWATGVVLTRGPQMISNPNSPLASHGNETNAIGPATLNNSMDAVSLGDGGNALLTFERPIRNGEGPDFVVFENDNIGTFLELAFVEVSSDGEHFVRFPATSLTPTDVQVGSFGSVDPTFINNLAGKFKIGYGTPFDLEELAGSENLDIDSIVYVRVIDAIGTIDPQYASYDAFGHIVNDPWPTNFASSGFDLSGVGVIHQKPVGIEDHDVTRITVYPNPCSDRIYVNLDEVQKVELYNMNGRLLEMIQPDDTHFMLDMQKYPAGMYLLKVGNGVQKIMKK